MNALIKALVDPFRGRVALFDSNVLLLYLVSEFNPELIGANYKRLAEFEQQDIELINWLAGRFRNVVTLPHVLTEVSNLSNQMPSHIKRVWFPWFGRRLQEMREESLASGIVGNSESFLNFGLTDACLSHLANTYVIVTSDFPLSGFLQAKNLPVINFNHLRQSWLKG